MFPSDPMEGAYPDDPPESSEPVRCETCGDLAVVFLHDGEAHAFCRPCYRDHLRASVRSVAK